MQEAAEARAHVQDAVMQLQQTQLQQAQVQVQQQGAQIWQLQQQQVSTYLDRASTLLY